MSRNASSPAAGNKAAEELRDQQLSDVALIMKTRPGRRFMWRYLSKTYLFETSFNNSGSITAFNEGQRNVGLMMLADINEAAPEEYLTMLKESKEKQ